MQNVPIQYQKNSVGQYQDTDYIILPDSEENKELGFLDYINILKSDG